MRRCFYHTDLAQNAVFHNFSRQIAFIQYSGLSKHAWTFNQRNRSKKFQNHLYGQPVLTFERRQICEEILKELRFNVIKNLWSLFFIIGFITMCNLKKTFDTLGILSTLASNVYERLKTNGKAMKITLLRLPTINKEIQFGTTFTETTIFIHENEYQYLSVSKNPQLFTSKLKD